MTALPFNMIHKKHKAAKKSLKSFEDNKFLDDSGTTLCFVCWQMSQECFNPWFHVCRWRILVQTCVNQSCVVTCNQHNICTITSQLAINPTLPSLTCGFFSVLPDTERYLDPQQGVDPDLLAAQLEGRLRSHFEQSTPSNY